MKLPNDEYSHLEVPDAQMFRLIRLLKARGIIRFRQEFWDTIGILKQNARNNMLGSQHFTVEQITIACKEYNVNANFIHGLEKEPFRFPRAQPNNENILDQVGQNGVGKRAGVKLAANKAVNKKGEKSNI